MKEVSDKEPSKYFYAHNGMILKSLEDLLNFLKNSGKEDIEYHFNEGKNDFANWVKDVLKNRTLANKMYKSKTSEELISLIELKTKKSQRKPRRKDIISKIKGEFLG